jgi:hypothetical protein
METEDRFDQLVSHYLDDGLDPESVDELNGLLASRPDCARRFVRLSRLHASMREIEGSLLAGGGSEGKVLRMWTAPRRGRRQIISYASLATAAVALLALVFLLYTPEQLLGPTVGADGSPAVLLVAGRVDPVLTAGDLAVRDRLVALGFRVTPVKEDAATAELARGKALVVISESTRSDLIGGRLQRVPVPILNCEPHLNHTLGLSRGPGTSSDHFAKTNRFRVRILVPDHPLAGGLKDLVRVYESKGTVGWGLPADSAVRLAVCDDNADQTSIFAYESGAVVREEKLAARRVSFFLADHTQEAARMTPEGWKLFDAAVSWLASSR